LARFIRKKRVKKGLTVHALARRLKISQPTLSGIELGREMPSRNLMEKIAQELEIPFEELLANDLRPALEYFAQLLENDLDLSADFIALITAIRDGKEKPKRLRTHFL
jgi:transcriptional regulator with XRE-family HTH domain